MSNKLEMPNPTKEELESPEFEAIWQLIKSWDVNVPSHYEGYCGANGSHVKMILDALRGVNGSFPALTIPDDGELRLLITRSANEADRLNGSNYYTAAEFAVNNLLNRIKELNQ